MPVLLDGRPVGETTGKTFLLTVVEPGPHQLLSKAENESVVAFTAAPDSNVFIAQEVKAGDVKPRAKLQLVGDTQGKERVMGCDLAPSSQAR